MRTPLRPFPEDVNRWMGRARRLRWLDALAAWLAVWAVGVGLQPTADWMALGSHPRPRRSGRGRASTPAALAAGQRGGRRRARLAPSSGGPRLAGVARGSPARPGHLDPMAPRGGGGARPRLRGGQRAAAPGAPGRRVPSPPLRRREVRVAHIWPGRPGPDHGRRASAPASVPNPRRSRGRPGSPRVARSLLGYDFDGRVDRGPAGRNRSLPGVAGALRLRCRPRAGDLGPPGAGSPRDHPRGRDRAPGSGATRVGALHLDVPRLRHGSAPGRGGRRGRRPTADGPAAIAPGLAQGLIAAATGRQDAGACGHPAPRGLRTDADHARRYALLLGGTAASFPGSGPSAASATFATEEARPPS